MIDKKAEVHVFQDGTYLVDGGALFGGTPKTDWLNCYTADEKNRVRVAINYFLIVSEDAVTLIDTGMGNKLRDKFIELVAFKRDQTLVENLRSKSFSENDVSQIIFTHLHYDHAGGATILNKETKELFASLPNARFIVQRDEWKTAINPDEISRSSYKFHDFLPLAETGNLKLISGTQEISKGIRVQVTGGHTAAHQMIIFKDSVNTFIFPGDICPTEFHLELDRKEAFDLYPQETLRARKAFLKLALKKNTFVGFSHASTPTLFKLRGTIQSCVAERV